MTKVRFYFDPVCPWAWRASLWMREVAKVRDIEIEWDFLSLKAVNSANKENLKDSHFMSEAGFRVMALLRREKAKDEANDLIDRLYIELGKARHDHQQDIGTGEVMQAVLSAVGLDTTLLNRAMSDDSTLDDVQNSHIEALRLGSFGVPALLLPAQTKTTFGPVLDRVPTGEDAGQLWDRVSWLMERPEFFELKRTR